MPIPVFWHVGAGKLHRGLGQGLMYGVIVLSLFLCLPFV